MIFDLQYLQCHSVYRQLSNVTKRTFYQKKWRTKKALKKLHTFEGFG